MSDALPPPAQAATTHVASTVHLDAVRGAAAMLVVLYHIRYKFFLDYSQVNSGPLLTKVFYVATSFGHDAVMVFFVLSGYLISGTVIKDLRARRWSWSHYLANRLTRLYVVLLPGLALTVAWDLLGMRLFSWHPVYTGAVQAWKHDFFNVSETLTPTIFFANVAFMQAVAGVPPLGSNSPLWSLTYELAYYLIFPAAMVALWHTTRGSSRVIHAVLTVLAMYYFGPRILLYFPIWLIGFGVRFLPALPAARAFTVRLRNLAVVALVFILTAARHTSQFAALTGNTALEAGDYVVGAAFGFALYVLLQDRRSQTDGTYVRVARASALLSYTLYVVHMPFLLFLRAAVNDGPQWSLALQPALGVVALFAATLVYAWAIWYFFEARTEAVRRIVERPVSALRSLIASGS